MKHLKSYKLDHPDVMAMMDDIDGLQKLIKTKETEMLSYRHRINRLQSIMVGKGSELFEAMQMIYGIEEPPEGFMMDFNFKRHLVRLIEQRPGGMIHNPFHVDGDEWRDGMAEEDVDWDNPEHVEAYNKQRAKKWEDIKKAAGGDGIDWSDKDDKDDDDDETQTEKV